MGEEGEVGNTLFLEMAGALGGLSARQWQAVLRIRLAAEDSLAFQQLEKHVHSNQPPAGTESMYTPREAGEQGKAPFSKPEKQLVLAMFLGLKVYQMQYYLRSNSAAQSHAADRSGHGEVLESFGPEGAAQ